MAADEDQLAHSRLAVAPGSLVVAFDDHVNALQHVTLIVAFESQDPLEPKNIRPLNLSDFANPGEEPLRLHLAADQRYRSHRMIMPAVIVVIVMAMLMVIVAMIVLVFIEKVRIERQDPVKIEGAAIEHKL